MSFLAGAVELRKELSTAFGVDLPPTFVFDYPSVQEMTAAILHLRPGGSQEPDIIPATEHLPQHKPLNHGQNVLEMVRGLPT